MHVQPVHLEILSLLHERAQTGLNVNGIYRELVKRKFSRNKKLVIMAIRDLEKGHLLETAKGRRFIKRLKQKRIKLITTLGEYITRLIFDLNNYEESCSDLKKAIIQHFDIKDYSSNKIRSSVLHNRGWKPEEIADYERFLECSNNISKDLVSSFQIINAILTRYILILSKIGNNENAKMILDYIITGSISKQLSNTIVSDVDKAYGNLVRVYY